MTPTKQTVYLPVKVEDELPEGSGFYKTEEEGTSFFQRGDQTWWNTDVHGKKRFPEHWLKPQEGYFFTPEQLNEYTANVVRQALETAAEKATLLADGELTYYNRYIVQEGNHYSETEIDVSKQSITNTFEETCKKFEV